MMTVRCFKKLNVINDVSFLKSGHYVCVVKTGHCVALFQKFVDILINGRPSFFRIDSVHQMETSLSDALLVD
jgi:hypothetical protein